MQMQEAAAMTNLSGPSSCCRGTPEARSSPSTPPPPPSTCSPRDVQPHLLHRRPAFRVTRGRRYQVHTSPLIEEITEGVEDVGKETERAAEWCLVLQTNEQTRRPQSVSPSAALAAGNNRRPEHLNKPRMWLGEAFGHRVAEIAAAPFDQGEDRGDCG